MWVGLDGEYVLKIYDGCVLTTGIESEGFEALVKAEDRISIILQNRYVSR